MTSRFVCDLAACVASVSQTRPFCQTRPSWKFVVFSQCVIFYYTACYAEPCNEIVFIQLTSIEAYFPFAETDLAQFCMACDPVGTWNCALGPCYCREGYYGSTCGRERGKYSSVLLYPSAVIFKGCYYYQCKWEDGLYYC